MGHTRQRDRDEDVKERADGERAEDPNRKRSLGVLRLLRHRAHGVEADIGEEDDARACKNAAEAPAITTRLDAEKRVKEPIERGPITFGNRCHGRNELAQPAGGWIGDEIFSAYNTHAEKDED